MDDDYNDYYMQDVIINTCSTFHVGLAKSPLKVGDGRIITYYCVAADLLVPKRGIDFPRR